MDLGYQLGVFTEQLLPIGDFALVTLTVPLDALIVPH
jgi:hypothetical protein